MDKKKLIYCIIWVGSQICGWAIWGILGYIWSLITTSSFKTFMKNSLLKPIPLWVLFLVFNIVIVIYLLVTIILEAIGKKKEIVVDDSTIKHDQEVFMRLMKDWDEDNYQAILHYLCTTGFIQDCYIEFFYKTHDAIIQPKNKFLITKLSTDVTVLDKYIVELLSFFSKNISAVDGNPNMLEVNRFEYMNDESERDAKVNEMYNELNNKANSVINVFGEFRTSITQLLKI